MEAVAAGAADDCCAIYFLRMAFDVPWLMSHAAEVVSNACSCKAGDSDAVVAPTSLIAPKMFRPIVSHPAWDAEVSAMQLLG